MRYDGTPDKIGMNPYLTAKLGARKKRGWGLPTGVNERYRNSAGAIDLQEYSMLLSYGTKREAPKLLPYAVKPLFTTRDAL